MNKNYFKFSLSYRDKVVSERIFDADCYNPQIRQMVNIKDLVPEIRKVLQKVLSIPTQKLSNEKTAKRGFRNARSLIRRRK